MKNIIRVLAKEVRRVRALEEIMEKAGITYPRATKELDFLRRTLAMLIKRA